MTELSASQFIWRFHQRTNLITIPAHVLFREMCNIKKSTGRTKLCGLKWRHKACLPWFSTAKLQFQTNGQHPEETLRRWPENVRCLSWWEKHAGWTVLGEVNGLHSATLHLSDWSVVQAAPCNSAGFQSPREKCSLGLELRMTKVTAEVKDRNQIHSGSRTSVHLFISLLICYSRAWQGQDAILNAPSVLSTLSLVWAPGKHTIAHYIC